MAAGPALAQLNAEADRLAEGAYAANTRRAYQSDWDAFVRWCEGHELPSLPSNVDTLCERPRIRVARARHAGEEPRAAGAGLRTRGPAACADLTAQRTPTIFGRWSELAVQYVSTAVRLPTPFR
ncbi:MAG: hypothetical protein RLZZ450_6647 [Pseudomonadota bacterium]|jgi:hypothetical protein